MIYGSVCSGIEAASLAWEQLGWNPAWFAEIESFPSAVLAHHWPHVTNLGDMTKIATAVLKGDVVAPDILVGGTPCQAFSVAGAREGLADDRGFLTIKYVELANAIDQKRAAAGAVPCITVWENVPGVLSSKDNAFGAFLGFLAGEDCELVPPGKKWENAGCVLGPQRAIAWRILDAQYFGVAQRRRRVFVVASAREGFDPAKVLFECEGVCRDPAPSREAGENATATASASFKVGSHWDGDGYAHPTLSQSHNTGGIGASNQELFSQRGAGLVPAGSSADDNQGQAGHLIPLATSTGHISHCLNAGGMGRIDYETETMVVHGTQDPDTNVELAHTLGRNQGQENAVLAKYNSIKDHDQRVIFAANNWDELVPVAFSSKDYGGDATENMSPTLLAGGHAGSHSNAGAPPAIATAMAVRRLTPVECERLQGFPDGWTNVPYRGKPAADGPRYKAIGNSMAVPCMAFIGQRIDLHLSEIDLPAVDEEAA
ncbi:DNA (cytosine-5-)-methyltransferase [Aeromonas jandaei]|uniref:DNA (cytosine-5-)-methyltransferase n=1 Tax=Aeromonas jandaei TaxID=650 RepID=UPI002B05FE82|nr:DNA (cytosine-5-)-methyltransferase [Aeromonas jandaei]